ncbi:MAG: tetratricopeptide repeat protein [Leptolyngbyaceae bacterium]|nr:tetratricopeptide repeat protein [Leptolyngbyaceae bacterium]
MVQTLSSTVVDLNQKTYQRLKAALELNLRRQIFIAVCDNLVLRDRLVAELDSDLSGHGAYARPSSRNRSYPQFVTLKLDLSNPNPIGQIAQWLREFPPPVNRRNQYLMPAFQLVGIEQLSRQSASVQWLFLNHLRGIEHSLPVLESSMVLWVTRPWSRMIPQSAPDFWRCRTAVFDFIGEPTPLVSRPETFPLVSTSTSLNRRTARTENGHPPSKASDRSLHVLRFKPNERPKTSTNETAASSLPSESVTGSPPSQTEIQTEMPTQMQNETPTEMQPMMLTEMPTDVQSELSAHASRQAQEHRDAVDVGDSDTHLEEQGAIAQSSPHLSVPSEQDFSIHEVETLELSTSDQENDLAVDDTAASSFTAASPYLEDQEPLVLDEHEPEIQATLNDLMNGTLMEDLGGLSADTEDTLGFGDIRAANFLGAQTVDQTVDDTTASQTEAPSAELLSATHIQEPTTVHEDRNTLNDDREHGLIRHTDSQSSDALYGDDASVTHSVTASVMDSMPEQPEAEQPETEQPEAEQPELDQPELDEPELEQPETEQTSYEEAHFSENLGFGSTLNDPWSVPSREEPEPSESVAEETTLRFSIPDIPDIHDDDENVTDVLIPIDADIDGVEIDGAEIDEAEIDEAGIETVMGETVADERITSETVTDERSTGADRLSNGVSQPSERSDRFDASDRFDSSDYLEILDASDSSDTSADSSGSSASFDNFESPDSSGSLDSFESPISNGAGVPSSILLPYDAEAESAEMDDAVDVIDVDGDLQILDAEPNFLNASLSSDPALGFSTVGQPAAQRSWLESSLTEAAQADLAVEDPQAHALVQQIERLRQQQAPQTVLAGAYRGLGNLYRDRIEQGDISPKNLVRAMKAYESVLQMVSDNSPTWSEVLNDMGNLCWLLSRCAPTPEQGLPHLQQGIQAYRMALTKINPKTHPQTYPMIQNNLGAAYGDLARYHNPFDNLQQSVQAYQEALRYRKAEDDPMRFASTQNNLGTTYWNLAQYRDAVQNLKRATDAYAKALVYYQPDTDPLNYAMIQNNLGTAFWNLAQHDHSAKWLSAAIDAYTVALEYRTLETNPVAYAATQNNLGTAYWHISEYHEGDPETRMGFLRQAVRAYGEALSAAELIQQSRQPIALNFDVFATRNNFGLVQYQLATDSQFASQNSREEQLLENALDQHLFALQGWQGRPELRQTALQCVIQTLKAIYSTKGLIGQNLALSKIPGQLLPEILPQL